MWKRFVITMGLVALVIFGLGFAKVRLVQAQIAKFANFSLPPEAVTTVKVHEENWPRTLGAVGSLVAVNGVTLSADLPGVVQSIAFQSGTFVKAGTLLAQLGTDQEEAQLRSAQAKLELARTSRQRARDLFAKRTTSQSDLDQAEATYRQEEASVAESRAVIARKTLRAPFDGELGIRRANLGQYLNSGDPVVALQSLDPIYVNFSLPQQNLAAVSAGTEVQLRTDATEDEVFTGKVTAINSLVDEATRNVLVQATLANPTGHLRPGMFAKVEVVLPRQETVLPVPASAISYAPYGNSIFVVTQIKDPKDDKKPAYLGVRQQFVKLGSTRGDLVAVVGGLKPDEEVVTSGVFKLRNGAAVSVQNKVQPSREAAPKPEDS